MLDFVADGEGEEYSGNGENSYLEMRDFLKEIFREDGASGRMTHWRSPFGPLLKQRFLPGAGGRYRHLFHIFIAENYGE
ncbi:hypothetical protein OM255_10920, partial [Escherichia albertii]|nr:hypothetical protein [Shigella boydii]MCZ8581079.1 hypothetical protein [Escherichia albertii]EFZ6324128.1 hypothetical protein [Shigella boydii]MCZ8612475.1 hypothetical protein [Escherichia albertii]MCZ8620826.1 hypothetical protein [Escherichia albertii]